MNELLFLSLNKVNAIFKKCTVGNIQLVGHDFFFLLEPRYLLWVM